MKIQIHHDDHIRASTERAAHIEQRVRKALRRFGGSVTAVEVHLSDENGPRTGESDTRCLIEARLSHLRPIAASHRSDDLRQAIAGAAAKLERSIDTRLGRLHAR